MPYRALTSSYVAGLLRRVAERHGYTSSRGPHAGKGDPVALAFALGSGELATVLLDEGERGKAIRWLDAQATLLSTSDPFLAETIKSIADQLNMSLELEVKTDEEEMRSYLVEETLPMIHTYPLSKDQAARLRLDEKAGTDGYEDAREHYPSGVIEGDALQAYAESLVDEALDDEDLTDDPEEYRARYVSAYTKAYTEQIVSMKRDELDEKE